MSASSPEAPAPALSARLRLALPIGVIVAILAGVTVLLVGGGSKKPPLPGNATASATAAFVGLAVTPAIPAPPLDTLRNYNGASFSLGAQHGKAVFLTFLYAHCPDVCPLIASHLHSAYVSLPAAIRRRVAIVAVSVDPRGDTPGEVAAFVHEHELTGEASYLIGSAGRLAPVWKTWNVGSQRDVDHPDLVNHTALIYGISARGRIRTIYPANFTGRQIAHDVPRLL